MVNVTYVQRQAEPAATTGEGATASTQAEAPQAAGVDIERLAEQVFQRLRRRLQIEADRLGWPGWR